LPLRSRVDGRVASPFTKENHSNDRTVVRPAALAAAAVPAAVPSDPGTTLPVAPPRNSRKRTLLLVAGFVVTFLVAFGIGVASAGGGSTADASSATPAPTVTVTVAPEFPALSAAPAVSVTPTVKPTPAPKPKPTKAVIQDGYTVVVGTDVPPGVYQARSDSTDCYWEITKHGSPSDIIDNGGFSKGRLTVTPKKGQDFDTGAATGPSNR
jgi:hypothetical protein